MASSDAHPEALAQSSANPKPPANLPLVTFNDLLWLLYLYPIRWLARLSPRSVLYSIGKLADPIVQFHARSRTRRATHWIAQACGVSIDRAQAIARGSVSNNLLRILDELMLLRPSPEAMLRCKGVEGIEHLDRAIAGGRGVLLVVGHFYANRIAVRYLTTRGYAILAVHNLRPSNASEGWLGRRFLQPRFIALQKLAIPDHVYIQDPDCSLKIMRRLRVGRVAVLQMDGRAGTHPIEYPFLGVRPRFPSGILELARLSGCAVVPMLCLGRSAGFRIRFDPMLEMEHAPSREAFAAANLPRFLAVVERQIIENPEEWRLWNQF